MRASVFIATSLDGFIARADGGLARARRAPEPRRRVAFVVTAGVDTGLWLPLLMIGMIAP